MRPDAGKLHVRFDERRLETGHMKRTEAPDLSGNSYSPASVLTAPVVDSTYRDGWLCGQDRDAYRREGESPCIFRLRRTERVNHFETPG